MKKFTKKIVSSAITLGVGNVVLGGMGQGALSSSIMQPATKGLGVVASAGYGMGVLGMMNSEMKKLKKRKH